MVYTKGSSCVLAASFAALVIAGVGSGAAARMHTFQSSDANSDESTQIKIARAMSAGPAEVGKAARIVDTDAQGRPVDPIRVAHELERRVRIPIEAQGIDVHIIGFAKVVGDIADGATSVVLFAIITVALTLLAVRMYSLSWRVAFVPVLCSVIAVIWQLGVQYIQGYFVHAPEEVVLKS